MAIYDREAPDPLALDNADAWVTANTSWPPLSLGFIVARLDYMRHNDSIGEMEYTRLRNSAERWATA